MGSVAPSSLRPPRPPRSSRPNRGSASTKSPMKGRTTVLGSFFSSQITGKGCKSLRQLQSAVYYRLSSSTVMADYCLQLERHLGLEDLQACKSLLQVIAPRIYEHSEFHGQGNEDNREGFILCGGDVLLMKILCSSLSDGGGRSPRSADSLKDLLAIRNDCMSILRELCYSTPFFSYSLCVHDDFIISLFTMMQRPETFVYGVGLAEEILAVREETLSLKSIPDFKKLVTSLSARQLALFCRVLAMVVFEPEERIPEGLSAGKDGALLVKMDHDDSQGVAVADMNHDTLLETPEFLSRLVKLLHVKRQASPNQVQSPLDQIFAQLHAIGLDGGEMQPLLGMAHLADQEDWEELEASIQEAVRGESELTEQEPPVEVGFAVQAPQPEVLEDEGRAGGGTPQVGWGAFFGGRLWGTGNSRQQTSQGMAENVALVQNGSQQNGQTVVPGPGVGRTPAAFPGVDPTQGALASVIMLDGQNDDDVSADWFPVANQLLELGGAVPRVVVHQVAGGNGPAGNEEAGATTVRTRELAQNLAAALGNGVSMMGDDASDPFQSLSYVSHKVEVLFVLCALCGGKRKEQVQDRLAALGLVPALAEMFDRLDWQLPQPPPPEPHGIHGPGCACNPQSALKIQYLRLLHNFCDRDGSNRANKDLLIRPLVCRIPISEGESSGSTVQEKVEQSSSKKEGEGLMAKVLHLLMDEPCDSVYRFWLASCVEAFLRGSDPRDQEYVASTGLMEHLLAEILKGGFKCAPTLQINFDLLGELIKFNPSLFARFNKLLRGKQFDRLVEVIVTHLVDSNVFIRAVVLSLEAFRTAKEGPLTQLQDGPSSDPDRLAPDWPPSTQVSREDAGPQASEEASTSGCGGYMSSFEDAAAFDTDGCKITAFMACNALRLLRDLMCAVRPGDINQDNICVLNTALIFFILAERNGHLGTYLQALRSADMGGPAGGMGSVARNFRTLLDFWRDYYARRRGRDRASLEYSTTILFSEWERMVGLLCAGPENPMSLLYSPATNQCATLSASTEPPRRRC